MYYEFKRQSENLWVLLSTTYDHICINTAPNVNSIYYYSFNTKKREENFITQHISQSTTDIINKLFDDLDTIDLNNDDQINQVLTKHNFIPVNSKYMYELPIL